MHHHAKYHQNQLICRRNIATFFKMAAACHEQHLVVFVTVQTSVAIDTVISTM